MLHTQLFFLLSLVCFASFSRALTFYIDSVEGNDDNQGTLITTPFKTILPVTKACIRNCCIVMLNNDTYSLENVYQILYSYKFTSFTETRPRIVIKNIILSAPTFDNIVLKGSDTKIDIEPLSINNSVVSFKSLSIFHKNETGEEDKVVININNSNIALFQPDFSRLLVKDTNSTSTLTISERSETLELQIIKMKRVVLFYTYIRFEHPIIDTQELVARFTTIECSRTHCYHMGSTVQGRGLSLQNQFSFIRSNSLVFQDIAIDSGLDIEADNAVINGIQGSVCTSSFQVSLTISSDELTLNNVECPTLFVRVSLKDLGRIYNCILGYLMITPIDANKIPSIVADNATVSQAYIDANCNLTNSNVDVFNSFCQIFEGDGNRFGNISLHASSILLRQTVLACDINNNLDMAVFKASSVLLYGMTCDNKVSHRGLTVRTETSTSVEMDSVYFSNCHVQMIFTEIIERVSLTRLGMYNVTGKQLIVFDNQHFAINVHIEHMTVKNSTIPDCITCITHHETTTVCMIDVIVRNSFFGRIHLNSGEDVIVTNSSFIELYASCWKPSDVTFRRLIVSDCTVLNSVLTVADRSDRISVVLVLALIENVQGPTVINLVNSTNLYIVRSTVKDTHLHHGLVLSRKCMFLDVVDGHFHLSSTFSGVFMGFGYVQFRINRSFFYINTTDDSGVLLGSAREGFHYTKITESSFVGTARYIALAPSMELTLNRTTFEFTNRVLHPLLQCTRGNFIFERLTVTTRTSVPLLLCFGECVVAPISVDMELGSFRGKSILFNSDPGLPCQAEIVNMYCTHTSLTEAHMSVEIEVRPLPISAHEDKLALVHFSVSYTSPIIYFIDGEPILKVVSNVHGSTNIRVSSEVKKGSTIELLPFTPNADVTLEPLRFRTPKCDSGSGYNVETDGCYDCVAGYLQLEFNSMKPCVPISSAYFNVDASRLNAISGAYQSVPYDHFLIEEKETLDVYLVRCPSFIGCGGVSVRSGYHGASYVVRMNMFFGFDIQTASSVKLRWVYHDIAVPSFALSDNGCASILSQGIFCADCTKFYLKNSVNRTVIRNFNGMCQICPINATTSVAVMLLLILLLVVLYVTVTNDIVLVKLGGLPIFQTRPFNHYSLTLLKMASHVLLPLFTTSTSFSSGTSSWQLFSPLKWHLSFVCVLNYFIDAHDVGAGLLLFVMSIFFVFILLSPMIKYFISFKGSRDSHFFYKRAKMKFTLLIFYLFPILLGNVLYLFRKVDTKSLIENAPAYKQDLIFPVMDPRKGITTFDWFKLYLLKSSVIALVLVIIVIYLSFQVKKERFTLDNPLCLGLKVEKKFFDLIVFLFKIFCLIYAYFYVTLTNLIILFYYTALFVWFFIYQPYEARFLNFIALMLVALCCGLRMAILIVPISLVAGSVSVAVLVHFVYLSVVKNPKKYFSQPTSFKEASSSLLNH
ncbi:hypothetical protein PCE1_004168 [Barthelona sp. PCE]